MKENAFSKEQLEEVKSLYTHVIIAMEKYDTSSFSEKEKDTWFGTIEAHKKLLFSIDEEALKEAAYIFEKTTEKYH